MRRLLKQTLLFVIVTIVLVMPTCCWAESEKLILSKDLHLFQLSEQVWMHTSFIEYPGYGRISANGLVVIDGNTAAIIDTPWNEQQTGTLFDGVKRHLNAEIEHVIVGHSHDDCMGGLAEAHRRNARSYGLELTKTFAEKAGKPLPQTTFSDFLTVTVGNTAIELSYHGGGHTVDNIVAWIPGQKILFGGCLVKTARAKNLGNTKEAELEAWPKTLQKVLDAYPEAKIVVPGHGPHGGKELITHTIDLCNITL